jgi:hypothetical protein
MFFRKAARTVNPVQTTGFFRVKWGRRGEAVDAGNPLPYDDFPLGTRP